ncbi:MAG: HD domain-containing protein [Candidatus Omnitrophica bacterium]|nr:HD domain-containing protein [Candidatus Omnitrophota bacterium]
MLPRTLKTRIILIFALLAILAISLTNIVFYKRYLNIIKEDLRSQLMSIAKTGTLLIDGDELASIPLQSSSISLPAYKKIQKQLLSIRDLNKDIRYVYTMVPSPSENRTIFVVDADPEMENVQDRLRSWPGDEFNAEKYPEMLKAIDGATADKNFVVDEWGAFLSGYAPIKNKTGKAVAIIGVDMDVRQVTRMLNRIKKEVIFSLFVAVLLSILLGYLSGETISRPVNKLIKAIRYITQSGDLTYKIKLKTKDELKELADSFNLLAQSLYETNKREKKLIFDTIQALNLALEASEPYMSGHSRRVTQLAELLARELKLPAEEIEKIKQMGLVHDIGKLSVDSAILAKPGKLTPEEWLQIKKHPAEGERILAPLTEHKPELALIRSHHERFDGKGYPDGLKAEQISLMVSILSLCDSFDAMVSERPYRPKPLSKEEALQEIKRSSGTQFDPQAVEAFISLFRKNKI